MHARKTEQSLFTNLKESTLQRLAGTTVNQKETL